MKTILFVVALALTLSFSGNASNVPSVTSNQTENLVVSKTDSSSATQTGKSKKKGHTKHHKAPKKTTKKN